MNTQSNPQRRRPRPQPIHPRLAQLNHDLAKTKCKSFDYVYAVVSGVRVRMCVSRNVDDHFSATAQIGPRAFRYNSANGGPATAIQMLAVEMKCYIATRTERERYFLIEDSRRMSN